MTVREEGIGGDLHIEVNQAEHQDPDAGCTAAGKHAPPPPPRKVFQTSHGRSKEDDPKSRDEEEADRPPFRQELKVIVVGVLKGQVNVGGPVCRKDLVKTPKPSAPRRKLADHGVGCLPDPAPELLPAKRERSGKDRAP